LRETPVFLTTTSPIGPPSIFSIIGPPCCSCASSCCMAAAISSRVKSKYSFFLWLIITMRPVLASNIVSFSGFEVRTRPAEM
jgi:nitrate reductase NapE component